ncbi:TRAM/LAG1/CLN8-like domain-containing protein [Rhodotorula toruloides]|uniref:TRAM/LAG1/CLN8-like domain-containing protein n=1 Tax=Rhodotorula toruloides TaxID=5286 RepID=A0A511KQI4_RHOTO|nr:TRAM/LAG1/CLN8-like domain-containing protein [Rhodotorula toruloides]
MSWIGSPHLTPSPHWVSLTQPLARSFHLTALPPVSHLVLLSLAASFAAQRVSALLSPRVFGKYYPTERRKRDDWDLHMVGWLYAFIATPIAIHLLRHPSPELQLDPLYGVALPEQRLSAIGIGYFIWDALVTFRHINTQGLGFFLHGATCLVAFTFTLKPFVLWCGPRFLIWELSTIFLNAHWLLDKLHLTGSALQLVNGLFLVSTYVAARLVFGTYTSYQFWKLMVPSANPSSLAQKVLAEKVQQAGWVRWLYLVLNLSANGLNFYWFRFVAPPASKKDAQKMPVPVNGKLGERHERRVKGE